MFGFQLFGTFQFKVLLFFLWHYIFIFLMSKFFVLLLNCFRHHSKLLLLSWDQMVRLSRFIFLSFGRTWEGNWKFLFLGYNYLHLFQPNSPPHPCYPTSDMHFPPFGSSEEKGEKEIYLYANLLYNWNQLY